MKVKETVIALCFQSVSSKDFFGMIIRPLSRLSKSAYDNFV